MTARYDTNEVRMTQRFTDALLTLMEAECEMMRESFPQFAAHWEAGRCYVGDLARTDGLDFVYGELEAFEDGRGRFAVIVPPAWDPSEFVDDYLVRILKELGPLRPSRIRQMLVRPGVGHVDLESSIHRLVQKGIAQVGIDMELELVE